ncbi:MAG: hypothetical protein KGI80_02090 [Verrucomicrobiota bacterium]|nr:hypothetical protein [Verrucomicrobiota bacterium]
MSTRAFFSLSGVTWALLALFLFSKGCLCWKELLAHAEPMPLQTLFGSTEGSLFFWGLLSLAIGFLKGHFVLQKSVDRTVMKFTKLPHPVRLSHLYPKSYLFLIGGMMLLGMLLRFCPLSLRGGIDIAVGTALGYGAFLYFRKMRKISTN